MASIELKSIFKAYGDMAPVIRDLNLHIAQGEFCVFVGPSGCGKSTLLRMPDHAHAAAGHRLALAMPAGATHLLLEHLIPATDLQLPQAA